MVRRSGVTASRRMRGAAVALAYAGWLAGPVAPGSGGWPLPDSRGTAITANPASAIDVAAASLAQPRRSVIAIFLPPGPGPSRDDAAGNLFSSRHSRGLLRPAVLRARPPVVLAHVEAGKSPAGDAEP